MKKRKKKTRKSDDDFDDDDDAAMLPRIPIYTARTPRQRFTSWRNTVTGSTYKNSPIFLHPSRVNRAG